MSNIIPLPMRQRTLAHVLLDITEARTAFDRSAGMIDETEKLDQLEHLQEEARKMIWDATGVTWNQISDACL